MQAGNQLNYAASSYDNLKAGVPVEVGESRSGKIFWAKTRSFGLSHQIILYISSCDVSCGFYAYRFTFCNRNVATPLYFPLISNYACDEMCDEK